MCNYQQFEAVYLSGFQNGKAVCVGAGVVFQYQQLLSIANFSKIQYCGMITE
jgi:hypothetical protein